MTVQLLNRKTCNWDLFTFRGLAHYQRGRKHDSTQAEHVAGEELRVLGLDAQLQDLQAVGRKRPGAWLEHLKPSGPPPGTQLGSKNVQKEVEV